MELKVSFWGVRGSKPTPGKSTIQFGGNTSCVQIEAGDKNLIFDAGTGIAELGNKMMMVKGKKEGDIFFSHLHWDHIQGLPFFIPLYCPGNQFRLYGEDKKKIKFQEVINKQMNSPYFPVTMGMMKADYEFMNIKPNQVIDLGEDIIIKTFEVNHPNGCLSYKVEKADSSVVYSTDTEPMKGQRRKDFLEFIRGTDVLIYDTHFTDAEYFGTGGYENKIGWGHSTWEEGTRISKEADIGYLILFHHKESRSDKEQREIELSAQKEFKNTIAAKEGMVITIGGEPFEKVVIRNPY